MTDFNFERLRADLEELGVPQGQVRHMLWLATPLAVGRTTSGDYEIFIRGSELRATSPLVRRHIQHGDWRPEEGGTSFPANRIVLPSAPHFASVAALIAIELLRAGLAGTRGIQAAFSDVEPIIEMAMRRGALSESVIVGLVGELTVLRQLILGHAGSPSSLMRVLDYWQGWQGGRDLRIGTHSIEVKTTQAASSIHEFSGLHQLEPELLPSGALEQLHLMSIGLAASISTGESLPTLVSSVIALLSASSGAGELPNEFERRVALYGSQSGVGYVHAAMRDWSVYQTRYIHTFIPRLYRVDDPAMRLLTRQMLAETFVQPQGLSFTMHVPEQVSAFNPAPDWSTQLEAMSKQAP
ncbi:PD-(D/E)XK motif protein [Rhizobium laguerreae]|uniref:PD-(D/E)XK motif protein n=1 Tax=Rhizobium laguerreae TaxID=1076926 RepID=UPI001C8FFEA5|nr:PD-(D/E)XK motif protein [Rhizobium laguerreae]MBY3158987.1 PD-(D/E)XK motif protein [Rhizobium laguerreae]